MTLIEFIIDLIAAGFDIATNCIDSIETLIVTLIIFIALIAVVTVAFWSI